MGTILPRLRDRLANRPDSEHGQALVRLAIACIIVAYLERMAHIAGLIAEQLGLQEDEVRVIEMAAPLHDLGKIAIPDAILLKPGPLTDGDAGA